MLAPDSLGQIWFGTAGTGLSVFKAGTGDFSNYQAQGKACNRLSGNDVSAICHTVNNVDRYYCRIGHFKYRYGFDRSYSLTQFGVSDVITFLLKGDDGTVWVGTSNSVVLVKIENSKLVMPPSSKAIHSDYAENVNHIFRSDTDCFGLCTQGSFDVFVSTGIRVLLNYLS